MLENIEKIRHCDNTPTIEKFKKFILKNTKEIAKHAKKITIYTFFNANLVDGFIFIYNEKKEYLLFGHVPTMECVGGCWSNRVLGRLIKCEFDTEKLTNEIAYEISKQYKVETQNLYPCYAIPYILLNPIDYSEDDYLKDLLNADEKVYDLLKEESFAKIKTLIPSFATFTNEKIAKMLINRDDLLKNTLFGADCEKWIKDYNEHFKIQIDEWKKFRKLNFYDEFLISNNLVLKEMLSNKFESIKVLDEAIQNIRYYICCLNQQDKDIEKMKNTCHELEEKIRKIYNEIALCYN